MVGVIQDFGFGFRVSGFWIWGFRVWGSGCKAQSASFKWG